MLTKTRLTRFFNSNYCDTQFHTQYWTDVAFNGLATLYRVTLALHSTSQSAIVVG